MQSKICRRCNVAKPASEFRPDPRYRDGLGSWCAPCHRERNSEWAKQNRKRLTAKAADYRAVRPDVTRKANKKHKTANKERLAAAHAVWARKNADKRRATDAAYRAAKLRAKPAWANDEAIAAIYSEATRRQAETGERLHVDHIVPLQSRIVCGLHCEANLQILRGPENESKRNFWWPDMPEEAWKQPRLFEGPRPKPQQAALEFEP